MNVITLELTVLSFCNYIVILVFFREEKPREAVMLQWPLVHWALRSSFSFFRNIYKIMDENEDWNIGSHKFLIW